MFFLWRILWQFPILEHAMRPWNLTVTSGFLSQKASYIELWYVFCCWSEQTVEQTVDISVIWYVLTSMGRNYNEFLYQNISVNILCSGNRIELKRYTQHSSPICIGCQVQYVIHFRMHHLTLCNIWSSVLWCFFGVQAVVPLYDSSKQW